MYGECWYGVGDLVRLGNCEAVRTVVAQAWVLLSTSDGGWLRVPVYLLDDEDEGGYYEDWLEPAFSDANEYSCPLWR